MTRLRRLVLACALVFAAASGTAQAQVFVAFSGGNGTPLGITFDAPVTFTLTSAATGDSSGPFLVIAGTNLTGFNWDWASSSDLLYTTHGGNADSSGFGFIQINYQNNDVVAGDTLLSGNWANPYVADIGDSIDLAAGSFFTTVDYAAAVPVSGFYAVYISDGSGNFLGSGVSAVPEPAATAATLGALSLVGLLAYRRHHRISAPRKHSASV